MGKRTEFARDTIEVCRNCKAEGMAIVEGFDKAGNHTGRHKEICPVCGGSGLVSKHIEGFVTVEPYDKKKARP